MGQAPCDLCWFQRAFMFPLAIILGTLGGGILASIWASRRDALDGSEGPSP